MLYRCLLPLVKKVFCALISVLLASWSLCSCVERYNRDSVIKLLPETEDDDTFITELIKWAGDNTEVQAEVVNFKSHYYSFKTQLRSFDCVYQKRNTYLTYQQMRDYFSDLFAKSTQLDNAIGLCLEDLATSKFLLNYVGGEEHLIRLKKSRKAFEIAKKKQQRAQKKVIKRLQKAQYSRNPIKESMKIMNAFVNNEYLWWTIPYIFLDYYHYCNTRLVMR